MDAGLTWIILCRIMKEAVVAIMMVASIMCIGLPLVDNLPRCMIVYTDDEFETLKLDVIFP